MRVIRVEDSDGKGPYYNIVRWGEESPYSTSDQPSPLCDSGLKNIWYQLLANDKHHKWFFGFRDEAQAVEWFCHPEWWREMDKAGYRLVHYDVDAAVVGEKQVIFRKDQARKVGEELLDRFHNAECGYDSLQT